MILRVNEWNTSAKSKPQHQKMSFDGDIIICLGNLLTELDVYRNLNKNLSQYDCININPEICAENYYPIYAGDEKIGEVCDDDGCCELWIFYTKDLLNMTNSTSVDDMLDKLHVAFDNNNITRDDLDEDGEYPQTFEIKNFKGDIEFNGTVNNAYYGCDEVVLTIKGINSATGEKIDYVFREIEQ